ncbi:GNAT family N-acetyltransferase [Zobellia roscoffensis]|uniref:GNAT family N-acetyltransferase n=1 Tax=Zobellia roscoffensis TaxID=2779508 RepID=UPI00188DBFFC|nr:GNAT family N-acetyltransferase [Zobellia roscoffensis]
MYLETFYTDRLELRATSQDDADFIYQLLNSPNWLDYIGDRKIYSKAHAEAYINTKIIPQFKRLGFGNYTIIRKSDRAKIGSCGLYDREGLSNIDIGYALLPEYAKKGYAFEAALKLKEMAFSTFQLEKLCAITSKDNISSQKLLSKLGLESKETITLPGDTIELMLYTINKTNS